MRRVLICTLLLTTACTASDDDNDDAGDGSGTITFTLKGNTYTEATDVAASLQGDFMAITWNSIGTGDLGSEYYGSLTLSADYTGVGSYAPVARYSNVDAIIEDGTTTYYPLSNGTAGDGSVEVTEASATGCKGTFSFTGDVIERTDPQPIEGTFDVTFAADTDE